MQKIKYSIILLFLLLLTFNFGYSQEESLSKKIETILSTLSENEKKELLSFAEYLKTKATESDEEKQERIYKADNNIPTDESVSKIMEYSRYLTGTQKTPKEKMLKDNIPKTIVKFKTRTMDFEKAKDGDVLKFTYRFTNTGRNPLVFYDVTTPCGCTTPDWSSEPVLPGESGELHVTFDTKTKVGKQTKLVKILTNTDPSEISLFIKGVVEP